MTTTTTEPHDTAGHDVSDWIYVKVAIWLAFLTAIEVFTYFESVHEAPDWLLRITLLVLMVVKFFLVAAFFMHLKYDNAMFTKLFIAGLCIAFPVYLVMAYALDFLPDWHWTVKVLTVAVPPMITAIWLGWSWRGGDVPHNEPHHEDAPAGAS